MPILFYRGHEINHPPTSIGGRFYSGVLSIPSGAESDLYIQESNIFSNDFQDLHNPHAPGIPPAK